VQPRPGRGEIEAAVREWAVGLQVEPFNPHGFLPAG
jgi:hypothetical protein